MSWLWSKGYAKILKSFNENFFKKKISESHAWIKNYVFTDIGALNCEISKKIFSRTSRLTTWIFIQKTKFLQGSKYDFLEHFSKVFRSFAILHIKRENEQIAIKSVLAVVKRICKDFEVFQRKFFKKKKFQDLRFGFETMFSRTSEA